MKSLFNKLYLDTKESFYKILDENLENNKKMFIVTANPETFNIAENDDSFKKLLLSSVIVQFIFNFII